MALGTPALGTITYSTAGGTSVDPSYPAGIAAGDGLILLIGQKPATANGGGVTTPTGWTLLASKSGGGYGATLGADTGNTNLYAYTKNTVSGSETGTFTVTIADNDITWSAILRVPSAANVSYAATTGEDTTGDATLSITGAGDPGFNSGDVAVGAFCVASDNATLSAGSFTATGATFGTATSRGVPTNTLGNDIRGIIETASCTAGPSSAAPTATVAVTGTVTNARGPGIIIRVREITVHATTGALTGQGATVAGTAARMGFRTTTGALAGSGAVVAGTAVHNRPHATSGVLAGGGAAIAGTAARSGVVVIHDTSGTLLGQGAAITGGAIRFRTFDTSGDLAGGGASLSGDAARVVVHATSGDLYAGGGVISGSARRFGWSPVTPGSGTWTPIAPTDETWTPVLPAAGNWS